MSSSVRSAVALTPVVAPAVAVGLAAALLAASLAGCGTDRAAAEVPSSGAPVERPSMTGTPSAPPAPHADEVARVVIRGGEVASTQRENPVRAGVHTVWIGCEGTGRVVATVRIADVGVKGFEAPCGALASESLGPLPDGARVDLEVRTRGDVDDGWVVVDRQG